MFLHIQSIADVSAKFHLTVTDIVVWSKVVDCFSLVFLANKPSLQ